MAELPILPLYTDALIGDTTHMSPDEFGGYVRILVAMWRHGGRLPNDMAVLRRITGMTPRQWERRSPTILRLLIIAEGSISQKRLTDVYLNAREARRRRAVAAAARWKGKRRNRDQKSDPVVQLYPGLTHWDD